MRMSWFCCKCKWQNKGTCEDRKMYSLPTIEHNHLDLGRVKEWDVYCEECAKESLDVYEIKEEL